MRNAEKVDPAAAAQAARLREEIKKLVEKPAAVDKDEESKTQRSNDADTLSPREFIQRRMQELDEHK